MKQQSSKDTYPTVCPKELIKNLEKAMIKLKAVDLLSIDPSKCSVSVTLSQTNHTLFNIAKKQGDLYTKVTVEFQRGMNIKKEIESLCNPECTLMRTLTKAKYTNYQTVLFRMDGRKISTSYKLQGK